MALPILIILISVNYFGDAAKLFHHDYEKKMAEIINSGQYVTNISNYDERLFQMEMISNGNIKPNVLIMGSSRTMLLNSNMLSEVSLFNSSVSGASIEDIIGIYQLYKENNKLPQKIILGVDPWIFNDNHGQKRWHSIAEYYENFIGSTSRKHGSFFKYKELFSFSYFQSSIKMLPRIIAKNSEPQPTNIKVNITDTKLTDGSMVYSRSFRDGSLNEIENRIKSFIADGNIWSVENFNSISERFWNEFEKLMTDMNNNKIEIEFYLAPYAPLVYSKIVSEDRYEMVIKTEEIIKDFAKSNNISVYGSYSPFELGMDNRLFYDGLHPNEIGINMILEMNNKKVE